MFTQKAIKNIYEKLQDEISRKIFANRLMYSYTDDLQFVANIIPLLSESKNLQNWLNNRKNKKIFIYGAGNMGRSIRLAFSADFFGFIDNNAKKSVDGLDVISFDEFKEHHENSCVIIGSYTYGKEMLENVLSIGISDVFDIKAFHKPLENNQYFDIPEFSPNADDVLVDCGAFDGFNTLNFARLAKNKYKHIYCFEPNKDILPTLKKNLESIERFTLIEKGTWDKTVSKSFAYNNTGSKVIENFGGVH